MKWSKFLSLFLLSACSLLLSSCAVVEGIFKAGMGFGIFIVVLVIALIGFIIMKARK